MMFQFLSFAFSILLLNKYFDGKMPDVCLLMPALDLLNFPCIFML